MKTNKQTRNGQGASLVIALILLLASSAMVYADAVVNPSAPSEIFNASSTTTSYPMGSELNLTRGRIFTVIMNESQPTIKWAGAVGNITAEFALQDSDGDALYDWSITSITGEVYATREANFDNGHEFAGGGIPVWEDLYCANISMIRDEARLLNHTLTAEDSIFNTFADFSGSWPTWYAGENLIEDAAYDSGGDCYSLNLMENNTEGVSSKWLEVIMTDNVSNGEVDNVDVSFGLEAGDGAATSVPNIIYTSLIENHTFGFNGETYDFQIMVPQLGQQGDSVLVLPYYFYVELV